MILLSALKFVLETGIILSFICLFASIYGRDILCPVPRHEFEGMVGLFRIVVVWGVCNEAWFDLVPKYTEQPARSC